MKSESINKRDTDTKTEETSPSNFGGGQEPVKTFVKGEGELSPLYGGVESQYQIGCVDEDKRHYKRKITIYKDGTKTAENIYLD